jgi:uncharacterized membrane protein
MKKSFKVVEHKFNPSAVGQPRMVEVMGRETNLPQTTATTGRVVKKSLSENQAKILRDKLNAGQDFNADLEVILSYSVMPEARA